MGNGEIELEALFMPYWTDKASLMAKDFLAVKRTGIYGMQVL